MDRETLNRAKNIEEDISHFRDAVHFFAPMSKRPVEKYEEDRVALAKYRRRQFLLHAFMKDGKKKIILNFYGFFGGAELEVDDEFVSMCHDYFLQKMEQKEKEFNDLN